MGPMGGKPGMPGGQGLAGGCAFCKGMPPQRTQLQAAVMYSVGDFAEVTRRNGTWSRCKVIEITVEHVVVAFEGGEKHIPKGILHDHLRQIREEATGGED